MEKQRATTAEEKEIRRIKIEQSAKRLFSKHGFQGTKIGMITEDAGLSPAAFYLYFKSKIDIYRTLSLQGTDILADMIGEAIIGSSRGAIDKLNLIARAYFEFFIKEREYYNIIAVLHLGEEEFFSNLDIVPQLQQKSMDLLQILKETIKEGISSGEFEPVDSEETAAVLWGMIDGVLLMEVRKTTEYLNTRIETLMNRFIQLSVAALQKSV